MSGPGADPFDPAHGQLHVHARALARECGLALDDMATAGGSDANLTAPFAPPRDGLGADGQDGGHSHGERMPAPDLPQRTGFLHRSIRDLPDLRPAAGAEAIFRGDDHG